MTESAFQINVVRMLRSAGFLVFAVPNGGGRSVVEASIMKAEGVTAGVADLLLLEARGGWGCLCLEMKTKKKWSSHLVHRAEGKSRERSRMELKQEQYKQNLTSRILP